MTASYQILNAQTLQGIVNLVNAHIQNGWQPLGAVAVCTTVTEVDQIETQFYQAMVHEKDQGL